MKLILREEIFCSIFLVVKGDFGLNAASSNVPSNARKLTAGGCVLIYFQEEQEMSRIEKMLDPDALQGRISTLATEESKDRF